MLKPCSVPFFQCKIWSGFSNWWAGVDVTTVRIRHIQKTKLLRLSGQLKFTSIILNTIVLMSKCLLITLYRLELKHCEVGCFVQDKVIDCVGRLGENLRVLEIPGLGSDELLGVAARRCPNLEVINFKGSREQVSDVGFMSYVDRLKDKTRLLQVCRQTAMYSVKLRVM